MAIKSDILKVKDKITPKQAYEKYVEEDKSLKQAAKELGVSRQTVKNQLQVYRDTFFSNVPMLDYFKKNRSDIMADKAMMLTQSITIEKVAKASLKDLALSLEKLNNIERLERGQSTSNVDAILDTVEALTMGRLEKTAKASCGKHSELSNKVPVEKTRDLLIDVIDTQYNKRVKTYDTSKDFDIFEDGEVDDDIF